jgi:hypothetical protein
VDPRFADQPSAEDPPFLFLGWGDGAVARWMAEHEVPFLRAAGGAGETFPFVFDLGPSPAEEVNRLIGFAAERGEVPISVQAPAAGTAIAAAARAACRPPGCTPRSPARSVLCLDAASIRAVPGRALALVPSSLAEEAIAANPAGGTIIAARAVPSGADAALASAYHLAPAHLADQWTFLAAARLAENVLQRAGAGVTRASFVATLQQTRRFTTGFSPPLSFDADRSRGTNAVRLLRLDPRTGTLIPVE